MIKLKKALLLLVVIGFSQIFTNQFLASDNDLITFSYFEKRVEDNLINLNIENLPREQTFKSGVKFTHISTPKSPNYTFNYWVYYLEGIEHVLKVGDQFFEDTNFYAVWTPTLRGVYYNLNGGVNHPDNPSSFYGYETITLKNPTKEDYRFLGWYDNPGFTGNQVESLGNSSKSISLYAKWEILPTIVDFRNDLNDKFSNYESYSTFINNFNNIIINFNEVLNINVIFNHVENIIDTLVNSITSGEIFINGVGYNLVISNKGLIVEKMFEHLDIISYADILNISYELDVVYKYAHLNFIGNFVVNVENIEEVEVTNEEELKFVLNNTNFKNIIVVNDITLTDDLVVNREVNIYVENNVLNLNGYEISFVETLTVASYEIKGVFQNGTITINNSNGHFEMEGLTTNNAVLEILASADNTVIIKGYWSFVVVRNSAVVEVIDNAYINNLSINDFAKVVIIGEDVEIDVIENNNNGLYYDEIAVYEITYIDYGVSNTVYINSGNKLELYIPSKVGYSFNGWMLNESLFDFDIKIKEDYVLVASYELNDFDINISGYSGVVTYPSNVVLTASNNALVGAVSYEWYKDGVLMGDDGVLTLTDVNDSGLYTVYATLIDGDYTLTLNKNLEVTILPEEVVVTPNVIAKSYGSVDPVLSYSLSKGISVSGVLTRQSGEDAGEYSFLIDELYSIDNNYKLVLSTANQIFTINKVTATVTSIFADIRGKKVIELDYTDNYVKTFNPEDLDLMLLNVVAGGINQLGEFEISFNTIDLTEGASTFLVNTTISGNNFHDIQVEFAFKFKSVIIQGSETLYTIEDALTTSAVLNNIIVLYNTSFSEQDVSFAIYGRISHTLKSNVYLILPEGGPDEDGKYNQKIDKKISGAPKIDRNNYIVRLNLPSNITLNVNGRLIVNGIRGAANTAYQGFVTGSSYSLLHLEENSKINLKNGGRLLVAGFIYGAGSIEAENGSVIEDVMFVESFRGGTDTYNVFEHAFPFNQFSAANIEVEVKINQGAKYDADVSLYMSGGFVTAKLTIVEPPKAGSKALITLETGYVIKKYNTTTGETMIELHNGGVASLNETSLKVSSFTISSEGIDMSFNGRWKFHVKDTSKLTINSYMLLFPGSSITVDENASLIVAEGARLTVFNPYEFIEDDKLFNKYPNDGVRSYFRTNITYAYNAYTPAKLNINGTLIVNEGGAIAGIIDKGSNSNILIDEGAITEYSVKYVLGSTYAYVLDRNVRLWDDEDYYLSLTANPTVGFKAKEGEVEEPFDSEIKLYVVDKLGNRASGTASYVIEIVNIIRDEKGNIIGTTPTNQVIETGSMSVVNGVGTFKFITDVHNGYEVSVTFEGITVKQHLFVGEASSPFAYSEDANGDLYFEHEPFGYSMIKAIEDTTYGTLRLIQDQDGIYYIQIIEEGDSTTALNNVKLYAIDYENNQGVIDAMFDINGNPHTIKERINPKEFFDNLGIDHLPKVLDKDNQYAHIGKHGELESYFVATFDRPDNSNHAKLLVTPRGQASGIEFVSSFLSDINYKDNLWWLDEALNHESVKGNIRNVFDIFNMQVEIWDGSNWVVAGSVQPKTYLDEELLIYLDLENINTNDLTIRLSFAQMMGYSINNIAIDYSDNVNMTIHELELASAMLNNDIDITELVRNIDENYVYLNFKDSARLGFNSVPLSEGMNRVIGISSTGYIYTNGTKLVDELSNEVKNKTMIEIIGIIASSGRPELMEYIEDVESLYNLLIQLGTLEREQIIQILMSLKS